MYKDISYGPDRAHKLDVYTRDEFDNAPIIFMVHGGAWKLGDKESSSVIKNKIERWLPAGFVFISINYRLMPRATDPVQQVDDVRNALITAQQRATEWGGDPEKFILMGHSAGAHLAGLVAASVNKHVSQGGKRWLGSVLLDSAALDVPSIMNKRHYDFYDDAFGTNPGFWVKASPYHQLKSDAPPVLITCSSSRRGACEQANAYADKANSLGVRASVISKDLSHKQMNENLGDSNDYTNSVESFFSSLNGQAGLTFLAQPVVAEKEFRKRLLRRWIVRRQGL
jgi:acetyl esterase/lipase